jgi:hypothetical protein
LTIPLVLRILFEEQLQFRLVDGTRVEGPIRIGELEVPPVEVLNQDDDAYTEEFNRWLNEVWLPEMADSLEQVLFSRADEKRYQELRKATLEGSVIPFVGSGMSVESTLPTWSQLLQRICEKTSIGQKRLAILIDSGKFEEAADLLSSAINQNLFDECVERELRLDASEPVSGAVRLVPVLFPNLAITTNLDNVLERCYLDNGAVNLKVLSGGEVRQYRSLKNAEKQFLLKLHGDLFQPDSRILLSSEFRKAYSPNGIARQELELLVRNNRLLFLGCSLGPDRTVRLVEQAALHDKGMPRHFAFLKSPSNSSARMKREEFLTRRRIFPIWYNGEHDESLWPLLAGLLDERAVGEA